MCTCACIAAYTGQYVHVQRMCVQCAVCDMCADVAGGYFKNWLYTLSYGMVGGPQETPVSVSALNVTLANLQPGSLYQFTINVTGLSAVVLTSSTYVFATNKAGKPTCMDWDPGLGA